MTTVEEIGAAPASPDARRLAVATAVAAGATESVGTASVDEELDPQVDADFRVDPAYTTSKQLQEEEEEEQSKAAKSMDKNGIRSLKSALIISGVVVAVIGAIFAVAKTVKEARH